MLNDEMRGWRTCDGTGLCSASLHIHGCFSDEGQCVEPFAHRTHPEVT